MRRGGLAHVRTRGRVCAVPEACGGVHERSIDVVMAFIWRNGGSMRFIGYSIVVNVRCKKRPRAARRGVPPLGRPPELPRVMCVGSLDPDARCGSLFAASMWGCGRDGEL